MPESQIYMIIGASLAGAKAAETLRAEGFDGRVLLVGAEPERPYERPPLSKAYLAGSAEPDSIFVQKPAWYFEHDVQLELGIRATALDAAAHTVTLGTDWRVPYDKVADSLVALLAPHGVAVHLEAEHLCTQMRGVRGAINHDDESLARRVRARLGAAPRVPATDPPPSKTIAQRVVVFRSLSDGAGAGWRTKARRRPVTGGAQTG